MILSNKEKELISKEIENLEKLSSMELVAVVTKRSGNYKLASAMFAIFSLFFISFLLLLVSFKTAFELIQIQLLVFIGIYVFSERFKSYFLKILPKNYKYQVASRNAHNQFFNLQLHKTKSKQVIMFFVSFDEKFVEIVVDEEISKSIPNSHWQSIVDEFISDIKDNQLLNGYIKAIVACSSILIEKFPIKADDTNELPNNVIEVK